MSTSREAKTMRENGAILNELAEGEGITGPYVMRLEVRTNDAVPGPDANRRRGDGPGSNR